MWFVNKDRLSAVVFFFMFLILPGSALCEETYRFERMWPTLPQPWYFYQPADVAVDRSGNVYVADTLNHRVQKFTSDGQFLTRWGHFGLESGQFVQPDGIAVDADGNVYVADSVNNRIQKFAPDGRFLSKWGSFGYQDGQFNIPGSIAADLFGNIYVVDRFNNRIQKFTSEGRFLMKWGDLGSEDGQFNTPGNIALDAVGNVYIADSANQRIQKFTSDGRFLMKWGSFGLEDGQFLFPQGIAIDSDGNIYVADRVGHCLQKFAPDGQFLAKGGSQGIENGQFSEPSDIAIDSVGNVYVADTKNDRVQKFIADGLFLAKWGGVGHEDGQFMTPSGIAVDSLGTLYVSDTGYQRIQRFTPDGQFLSKWGSAGLEEGQFLYPQSIAIGPDDSVYVGDGANNCIQKFTSDGKFLAKWGSLGSENGQFLIVSGIAVDAGGNVYVADTGNHRIQKFTSDGRFLAKLGSYGSGDGQLYSPQGVAVDAGGNIYVAESANIRVQKFSPDGRFLAKWGSYGSEDGQFNMPYSITIDANGNVHVADNSGRIQKFSPDGQFLNSSGSSGSEPGQIGLSPGIAVAPDGRMYVADNSNHRVQVFNPVTLASNNKAIILAGTSGEGDTLWNATQMNANFAYRALTYQGFTKETITYLSSDTDLDLDSNGVPDDVDGEATVANLQRAITEWAVGADNLVLCLLDHGGDGIFRANALETLKAYDLDAWLDALQEKIPGRVIVIYDACYSGSFLPILTPPAGKERLVITSASDFEPAYFLTQGSTSLSNFFWTHVFNGLNVWDAYRLSKESMQEYQTSLLDDNGNGIDEDGTDGALAKTVYIGNGTRLSGEAPQVGSASPPQALTGSETAALLYADNVTDTDGISRVWAVIRPPDYAPAQAGNPVQNLPSVDLLPVGENTGRYEAVYDGFHSEGIYQIAIYARDRNLNTSLPQLTTVSVNSPLSRKAVLVAGGIQSDGLWPAIEKNARLAYESFRFQGYKDEDIYFMISSGIAGSDGVPTLSNIRYALGDWAKGQTYDLVVYLIGNGEQEAFRISDSETLSARDLDTALDELQSELPGKVTVIVDAGYSGSFIPQLAPPEGKQRLVITSAEDNEAACFMQGGEISFSRYFWSQVSNGQNIYDSYAYANNGITSLSGTASQSTRPRQIDDNGNGIAGEKEDGKLARNQTLGFGIMLAADDPVIGNVSPEQILNGGTSAVLWADPVTGTGQIQRVWATILPPDFQTVSSDVLDNLPSVELHAIDGSRYEGTWDGFTAPGVYEIAVYATDARGRISLPKKTRVYQYGSQSPIVVDSDASEVEVSFGSGQWVDLRCKIEAGEKIWVLVELPGLLPGLVLARPSDAYCQEHGRYLFPLSFASDELYFSELSSDTRISFRVNDFTGIDELLVATYKGNTSNELKLIQRIRLIGIED